MKAIYKNIAMAALALGAVACSQEDDFSPSYLSDPDAVRITAQVGTDDVTGGFTRSNPIGTAEAQKEFNTGDQIAVNGVTYEKGETSWNPVGDAYLKWQTDEMTFTAYYPVGKNNASATTFTVPTEYTETTPIADADYMTYSGSQTKDDDKAVTLTMERKMVRIVVDEITFNDQFATGYSVTGIKVHANTTGYADGEPVAGDIQVSALQQDGIFYALLAPTTAADNATFLTVTVSDGTTSQDLTVKGIPATVAGNSYNYSLTVGKDVVSIGNVTVTDWNTGEITGGVAEEYIPVSTETELSAALANGGNIILTKDITMADEYGYTLTKDTHIDLNGHTITGTYSVFWVDYCTLTVTGNGTIKSDYDPNFYATINMTGFSATLNLLGDVDISSISCGDGEKICMSGGRVETLLVAPTNITVDITGGHVGTLDMYSGTLTISGGTFGFNPTAYLADGYTATEADGIWTVSAETATE